MKKLPAFILVAIGLLFALASCSPPRPSAPAPPSPSTRPTATPTPPTSNLPLLTSQDAAWAQVKEAARKEGKVTIYSFTFVGSLGTALAREFKESTGLDLEVVAGPGSVFMERLKMEARSHNVVGDILEGASTNAILAKQSGLTQTYSYLPSLKDTGVWLLEPRVDTEAHLLYYSPFVNTAWVNTRMVSPGEEPRSWRDFLDPRWKSKIVVSDPNVMPINNQMYILLTRYLGFDDEYFRTLGRQEPIVAPTARDRASRLARGEAPLTWVETLAQVATMVVEGAPIKPLDMKEGVAGLAQTLNVANGAPHPNAARVFMNWLLTREGQTANARIRSLLPLRTDVPDFTPQAVRVKFTKVVPITPKDDEDAARAMREQVLSRLWGRQ